MIFTGNKVVKLGYLVSIALFFSSFMERFYGRILWKVIRPKQENSMNILVFHPKHTHTHTHAKQGKIFSFGIFYFFVADHEA